MRGGVGLEVLKTGARRGIAGGAESEKSSKRDWPQREAILLHQLSGLAMNQTPPSPAQQAGSARLFGTVSDASQARVPDATVVVSAKESGIKGDHHFKCRRRVRVSRPSFGSLLD